MNNQDNNLKQRLRQGDVLIGTLVSLPSAEVVEILAGTGFDWLFLDAEHGAFNPQQTQSMLQASGMVPCLIRVPSADEVWIKKALDTGAAGIIVPQVNSAKQARDVIRFSKYSPQGKRGVGLGRAHGYGLEFDDYLNRANDETVVVIQVENKAAIEELEAIIDVDGIDAILIGPYDLSSSLGKTGQLDHPDVVDAISKITEVCQSAGIRLGIFGVNAESVLPYINKGFNLITAGVDTLFIIQSAKQTLESCRGS